MTSTADEYAARVGAWAAELRSGSSRTWAEFRDTDHPTTVPAVAAGQPIPNAANLELVRRLSGAGIPEFGALADLILATPGPGRGLIDVPLPWPGTGSATEHTLGHAFGTPPVEPEALPAEELIRICCGVLVRLLGRLDLGESEHPAGFRPPWKKGFVVLGAPGTAALVRDSLRARGLVEGGFRATYLVLGAPFEDLMAQRWSVRIGAGAAMRWQRMWRTAVANDRVPPGIGLPDLATRLTGQFGDARVHVVLAGDVTGTLDAVADVLGLGTLRLVAPASGGPLATDLLRRLNPLLTLALGEDSRARVVQQVWPEVCGTGEDAVLGAPTSAFDWAVTAAERMARTLRDARYAVHGDPGLVVPVPRADVRRRVDPGDVLDLALEVVGRTWVLNPARDSEGGA